MDLWRGRALALSSLGRVGRHAHSAGAVLLGLDGDFAIRARGRAWLRTRQAYIPARTLHELDCGETRMLTLYLAPGRLDARQLCARWDLELDELAPSPRSEGELLELASAHARGMIDAADLVSALDRFIGGREPARLGVEERVETIAAQILGAPVRTPPLASLAARVGLSPSRLRHVFSERAGVSIRALRRWQRMRAIGHHVALGASLTEAAHAQGFSDSAHLSRDFRAAFGIPPSRVFARGATVRVHTR